MDAARLQALAKNGVAFDTETHRVQPGLLAPPMVCASVAGVDENGISGALLDRDGAWHAFLKLISAPEVTLIGANIAYDMLVMAVVGAKRGVDAMPAIFDAYDRGAVFDVQIAEALHGVALGMLGKDPRTGQPLINPETGKRGRYSLATCVDLVLGRQNAKANDRFRQSYALLEDVPMAEWPLEARTYPVDDAVNTLETALVQAACPRVPGIDYTKAAEPRRNLHNLAAQCYAAWAMHLGASWGFNVDPVAVEALAKRAAAAREAGIAEFKALDFFKLHPKTGAVMTSKKTGAPCKNTTLIKRLVARAYGCHGACEACAGSGRVPGSTKCKNCGGEGSVPAPDVQAPCLACAGKGRVPNPKTTKNCEPCDGTGLNLESAAVPRTAGSLEEDEESGETSGKMPGVSAGRDACDESGDDVLMRWAEFGEMDKVESTYLPWLRGGIGADGKPRPICLRPNVLLDTGRASYGDVVQLLPRGMGIRECIVARPGYVLASVDYGGLELVTHGQSCLWIVGQSKLAEVINREGASAVHATLGAQLAGMPYEDYKARMKKEKFLKDCRQAAKPANFGFPGGMGAAKLVLQQRKSGPDTACENAPGFITVEGKKVRGYKGLRFCILMGGDSSCGSTKVTEYKSRPLPPTCLRCIESAEALRETWFKTFPENKIYFARVNDTLEERGEVVQHVSKRVRGGLEFCAAANGYFQGLAADGAKLALCRVAREQYVNRGTALFGTRTILFAHDELVVEMPESIAHEAAHRVSEIMVQAMREFCPDVAVEAPPALMRRWYKGADPVYVDGRLVPWEPTT